MKFIAEHITNSLITSEIIPSEDKELYIFGFHQGFILLFNILTMCLIGFLCGMLKEGVVFFLAYMPLRSYAGGYHAKTPFRCYMISIFMMITVLWIMRIPFWKAPAITVITVLAAVIILILAPVENINKPLDADEKVVYRQKTIFILGGLIILEILFWIIGQHPLSLCIAIALMSLALMLIFGRIKNKRLHFTAAKCD